MGPAENNTTLMRPTVLFGIVALLLGGILISLAIISRSLSHVADDYAPLKDATMEIMYQTSRFHVSFEEAIADERGAGVKEAWDFLDRADGYARAMLEGGENDEGRSIALDDPRLKEEIVHVITGLKVVRSIAMERLIDGEASGIGSALEAQFDEAIEVLLRHADHVKAELQRSIAGEVRTFRSAMYALSGAVVLLAFVIGYILFRYGRMVADDATRSR